MKKILAIFILAVAALALQLPDPPEIPIFPGDGNPQHDGQPVFCQNHDGGGWKHNCECHSMNPTHEQCKRDENGADPDGQYHGPDTSKCKVYCRKTECRCVNHCES